MMILVSDKEISSVGQVINEYNKSRDDEYTLKTYLIILHVCL